MKQEFGDEYIILFRAHYFISNSIDLTPYKGFVYDVSHYDDINELYVISDILITDYSSVFFDYANLKRPIFFYMYDFEEYKNNMRDFYIDLKELPGPICKTEDELITALKDLNHYENNYRSIYNDFNSKFTYLDDGNASARLIDVCFDKKDFE
jgi:CDP-glycerol glycerophosphotransferase